MILDEYVNMFWYLQWRHSWFQTQRFLFNVPRFNILLSDFSYLKNEHDYGSSYILFAFKIGCNYKGQNLPRVHNKIFSWRDPNIILIFLFTTNVIGFSLARDEKDFLAGVNYTKAYALFELFYHFCGWALVVFVVDLSMLDGDKMFNHFLVVELLIWILNLLEASIPFKP